MDVFADPLNFITDPSDWSNTSFPGLFQLDSLLRCHICKDLIKAPVLTSCDHIFCSMCIRRSLTSNKHCPLCHEETYESKLRKLLLLDEITVWFSKNRDGLLERFKDTDDKKSQVNGDSSVSPSQATIIDTIVVNDNSDEDCKGRGTKRKSTLRYESRKKLAIEDIKPHPPIRNGNKPEELVECPICSDFMPAEELQNSHIDQCLAGNQGTRSKSPEPARIATYKPIKKSAATISSFFTKRSPKTTMTTTYSSSSNSSKQHVPQVQPNDIKRKPKMPSFDSMISTPKLKEKLASLSLSTTGTRNQMESRLKEFINLYNANLDSINPVDDRVLVRRLATWESLSIKKPTSSSVGVTLADDGDDKKSKKAWRQRHKSEYDALIKKARMNMKKVNVSDKKLSDADTRDKSSSPVVISSDELFILPDPDSDDNDNGEAVPTNTNDATSRFTSLFVPQDEDDDSTGSSNGNGDEHLDVTKPLFVLDDDDGDDSPNEKQDIFPDEHTDEILHL